jgi:hypothetical protein
MHYLLHKKLGWAGTVIGLGGYGLFAMGIITEVWFFGIGNIAAILLFYALIKDRVLYASAMQVFFFLMNIIGMVRVML